MVQLGWRHVLAVLFIAGFAAISPRLAQAQTGKISGIVTDASNGQPIEGVQMVVQGTGYGALTGANGRYFIIAVPPGTYTVVARRIGYQSVEQSNVGVRIDVTREVNFALNTATTVLTAQRIVAEAAPLIEPGTTGSTTTISAEEIQSLPVTSISGVLALQQGFVETPQNTMLQSLAEEQRSTVQPIRVRGARGGAAITLIDGIPVNNPLFGSQALQLNQLAVQQLEFNRGYMEPQYGNALAGVINLAAREGGTAIAGRLDYSTTSVAGAFGSTPDELKGQHLLQGFLSGPVPGTTSRLRYAVSGQIESGASRVYQYDDNVNSWNRMQQFPERNPHTLDLIPGWQAIGGTQNRQFLGKLTFIPVASSKVTLTVIDQQRQNLGFDRRFLFTLQGDPWNLVDNILDSLGVAGNRANATMLKSSVRDNGRLYAAGFEQRFGRTNVQVRGAFTDFERNTCNIMLGVCVPTPFVRANFTENFWNAFNVPGVPYPGSDEVYGGEQYTTATGRADVQSQVTDHHNLQGGVSFVRHDIVYAEIRGAALNSGVATQINQLYRAKPIEAGLYFQDRIEYDFLTIKVGARYDYGRAQGRGFTDPLNPTNGTTAREVCLGQAPGLGVTSPFSRQIPDPNNPSQNITVTGTAACLFQDVAGVRPALLDSATRLAARDDFKNADPRTAFSPRIGISFPLSARSMVFFNAGRYTMNPLYHNLFRNSGVGTVAGPGDDFCPANQTKSGTNECYPPIGTGLPDFIGNPSLLLEQATQYEIGYGAEFGSAYSVNVAVFNRDETGLTGVRQSRPVQDIGATYNGQALPSYNTVVNQDFLTSRGVELQFRRRLSNKWGFDINYGWSRTTTNSPPPDRQVEIEVRGEREQSALLEALADVDQTHRLNAALTLGVRNDIPSIPLGRLLRNSSVTTTYRFASGFPYTPIRDATSPGSISGSINAGDINSGRAPSTQQVDLVARKGFDIRNVSYSAFVRVENLFDRLNCVQVYDNTGTCDSGFYNFANRRVGNNTASSSTSFDNPQFYGSRRSINTGITVSF